MPLQYAVRAVQAVWVEAGEEVALPWADEEVAPPWVVGELLWAQQVLGPPKVSEPVVLLLEVSVLEARRVGLAWRRLALVARGARPVVGAAPDAPGELAGELPGELAGLGTQWQVLRVRVPARARANERAALAPVRKRAGVVAVVRMLNRRPVELAGLRVLYCRAR
ncbi:MAG: hypothetical protein HOH04_11715, partial [Rhodospirillaceae bacterium]|nr:hypothetical protein [Rhodospirillaceae bacterium]